MLLRDEYPRPQFKRENWQVLNGIWSFDFDDNNLGIVKKYYEGNSMLSKEIVVPFAYLCKESQINDQSKHNILWYKRKISLNQKMKNKEIILCFNGVDYECTIWVNGKYAAAHKNGYSYFEVNITDLCKQNDNIIAIRVVDEDDTTQPRGKQYWKETTDRCWYYPTSGIWQSVWLEYRGKGYLTKWLVTPNIDNNSILTEYEVTGNATHLLTRISYKGQLVKETCVSLDGKYNKQQIFVKEEDSIDEIHFWHPNHPNLYDVELILKNGNEVVDKVDTYFGFRKVSIDKTNQTIYVKNIFFYSKLILDQGYWKDTHLTAPSIDELKKDIILSKEMGFNGARKHQKIEDPYYYYYADKLGFVVWGELPSAYEFNNTEMRNLMSQQQDVIEQLYNHPSIVAWVPLNESWGVRKMLTSKKQQDFARSMYYMTKAFDNTRIISSNDGWENITETDILAIHDYDAYGNNFEEKYKKENYDIMFPMWRKLIGFNEKYDNQPVILTEFGGVSLKMFENSEKDWGYGQSEESVEDYLERLRSLFTNIYKCKFAGFCYTQLTDVQQETNGILDENHNPKVDLKLIKEIIG